MMKSFIVLILMVLLIILGLSAIDKCVDLVLLGLCLRVENFFGKVVHLELIQVLHIFFLLRIDSVKLLYYIFLSISTISLI